MKDLKDLVKRHINEGIQGSGDPDFVNLHDEDNPLKDLHLSYGSNLARAFIYVKDKKATTFSRLGNTHYDITTSSIFNDKKFIRKIGEDRLKDIINGNWDSMRPENWQKNDADEYNEWNSQRSNDHNERDILFGRLWAFKLKEGGAINILVSWWPELSSIDMHICTAQVIKDFLETTKLKDIKDINFYCIDNNGDIFEFNKDAVKELLPRSEEHKEAIKTAKAIHLADQKAKREFFAAFRKNRDEQNQKIYNHTKSGTEAEWRSIRYQGDSLQNNTKPIKE